MRNENKNKKEEKVLSYYIQIFQMKEYYWAKWKQDLRHWFYRVYIDN